MGLRDEEAPCLAFAVVDDVLPMVVVFQSVSVPGRLVAATTG